MRCVPIDRDAVRLKRSNGDWEGVDINGLDLKGTNGADDNLFRS